MWLLRYLADPWERLLRIDSKQCYIHKKPLGLLNYNYQLRYQPNFTFLFQMSALLKNPETLDTILATTPALARDPVALCKLSAQSCTKLKCNTQKQYVLQIITSLFLQQFSKIQKFYRLLSSPVIFRSKLL